MTHLAAGSGCPDPCSLWATRPRLIVLGPSVAFPPPGDHAGNDPETATNVWVVQNRALPAVRAARV